MYFGKFVQNYDDQPILWRVLSVQGNDVLLLSEYVMETMPFGSMSTWEDSRIKRWMNEEFFVEAFSADEQKMIRSNSVLGKVFLPSTVELTNPEFGFLENEGKRDTHRCARGTVYAQSRNLYVNSNNQCSSYYTRTKGSSTSVDMVRSTGDIASARIDRDDVGIRPMMWISMPHMLVDGDGSIAFPYHIR